MGTVLFNPGAVAPPAASVEQDLGFGIKVQLRQETGLLSATIQAQLAGDLAGFREGRDILGRYGFAVEETELLSTENVAIGFAVIANAALRASTLIESWNLVGEDGEPVPITTENCARLFDVGVDPGTGAILMSTFSRLVNEPARKRAAEGNASGSSASGATAGEPIIAKGAVSKAPRARKAASQKGSGAQSSDTPRGPAKV